MKTATSGARAFIWTPGMVDPSTPVGPGTCCIGEASAINESGQIAGWGYDTASGLAQAYLADGGR